MTTIAVSNSTNPIVQSAQSSETPSYIPNIASSFVTSFIRCGFTFEHEPRADWEHNFTSFVLTIFRATGSNVNVLLGSLHLILTCRNASNLIRDEDDIYSLFVTAYILAFKILEDVSYSFEAWQKITGQSCEELRASEADMCFALGWRLQIPVEKFNTLQRAFIKYSMEWMINGPAHGQREADHSGSEDDDDSSLYYQQLMGSTESVNPGEEMRRMRGARRARLHNALSHQGRSLRLRARNFISRMRSPSPV